MQSETGHKPDKPGQILTEAESYARLFQLAKKIGPYTFLYHLPSVRYLVDKMIEKEKEEVRKRICGYND